jgi:hypothetical protein
METDAAVEKQRTVFPQPLAKRLGRFAQFPQARRLRISLNNQFRVGQYCSIKVGQFYVVKKNGRSFSINSTATVSHDSFSSRR